METPAAAENGSTAKESTIAAAEDPQLQGLNVIRSVDQTSLPETVEQVDAAVGDNTPPSEGSKLHGVVGPDGRPLCQPCAWFYKESGCHNAKPCRYCHLCPQGELKNRKKQKIQRLRTQASADSLGDSTTLSMISTMSAPMFEPLRRASTEPIKVSMCKPPPGLELTMATGPTGGPNPDSDSDGMASPAVPFMFDNNGEGSPDFDPPSKGSRQHYKLGPDGRPGCQPCVWFTKEQGCDNAKNCEYCHLCPPGELKNRKKQKIARIRNQEFAPEHPGMQRIQSEPVRSAKDKQQPQHDGADIPPWLQQPPGYLDSPFLGPPWGVGGVGSWMDHLARMDLANYVPDPVSFQMGLASMAAAMGAPMVSPISSQLGVGAMPPLMGAPVPGAMGSSVLPGGIPPELPLGIPPGGGGPAPPPPPPKSPRIPPDILPPATTKEDDTPPKDSPRGVGAGGGADKHREQLVIDLAVQEADSSFDEQDTQAPMCESPVKDSCALQQDPTSKMEFSEPPGLEGFDLQPRGTSQASVRTEDIGNRIRRVLWTVDSKKLKGSDKVAVSPSFKFPTTTGTFRMMLVPMAAHERKGGGSFKKAKGRGIVQVKCEDDLAEAGDVRLRISVRGGGDTCGPLEDPPRPPVVHNFADNGICGLPREHEEWDFQKHVDASQAFVVCLEILFPEETSWPDETHLPSPDTPALAPTMAGAFAATEQGDGTREVAEVLSVPLEAMKVNTDFTRTVPELQNQ